MSLAACTDRELWKRADPEARAELIKRGLAWDPPTAKRTRGLRDRADDRQRKFTR